MLRVQVTDDLPNIVGRADMWGGKRDRGFSELRYMGVNQAGLPVFRRRDVDIVTNETTMSRMRLGAASATVQPYGAGAVATGVGAQAAAPSIGALPPDTVEIVLDPSQGRTITLRGHAVDVLDFNAAGVRYRVR